MQLKTTTDNWKPTVRLSAWQPNYDYYCFISKCCHHLPGWQLKNDEGARCSFMVRAFTHGAMGRRINPSWWIHWAIFRFSQCSTTGVPKAMVCYPVCGMVHIKELLLLFLVPASAHDWCNKGCHVCYPVCGMMHIKEPLLLIGKSSPCGCSGFPFSLLNKKHFLPSIMNKSWAILNLLAWILCCSSGIYV